MAVVVTGGMCEPLLSVSNPPHNTLTLDAHRTVHFVHSKGVCLFSSVTPMLSNNSLLQQKTIYVE